MLSGRFGLIRLLLALIILIAAGCDADGPPATKPELLIYCGITMVHPITEIARLIEQEQHVKIMINQGGSEDLYNSLKKSRQGDIYFPGSDSYRQRYLADGLLADYVVVGYNQATLMVAKGNPKRITADIHNLTRKDLAVIIGERQSGSIGLETKRLLDQVGIYQAVVDNAIHLSTDSRNLNIALKSGQADLILNWRATAFFPENRDAIDVLDLDAAIAIPQKLVLNLTTVSKYPAIAQRFMAVAASPEGQAIFRKYGFLDNSHRFD